QRSGPNGSRRTAAAERQPPNGSRRTAQPPVVSRNPSRPACTSSGGAFHFSAVLPSHGATMIDENVRPGSGGTGPAARQRPSASTIVYPVAQSPVSPVRVHCWSCPPVQWDIVTNSLPPPPAGGAV